MHSGRTISIHAPTRGATITITPPVIILRFQSTLPQGERPIDSTNTKMSVDFNPRSHKGSDITPREMLEIISYFNPRSHKGSDHAVLSSFRFQLHFNPRSHKGSDNFDYQIFFMPDIFQSTLPQGERRLDRVLCIRLHIDFNPRSHKGSDRENFAKRGV